MSGIGEAASSTCPPPSPPGSPCDDSTPLLQPPGSPHADKGGGIGAGQREGGGEADAQFMSVSISSTPSPRRSRSRSATSGTAKPCALGSGRTQRLVLLMFGMFVLFYQFVSDHVYIWMMTTEFTSMLMPGWRSYCTHEALWVPFHSTPRHRSVAIVSVMDKQPDPNTPSFKRMSASLQAESLRRQEGYAELWGYKHVLWEVGEHKGAMGRRPAAWGKLLALREALEEHEFALYLDSDLALVNPMLHLDGFIDTLLRSGRDLLLSQDGNGVNTGVMLLRRSDWSRWLLDELWRLSSSLADCDCIFYYEQRAFHHALQTEQWRAGYKWWTRHIPVLGWFRNPLRGHPPGPTLEELPLLRADGTAATAEEVRAHVEVVPQCALNAVDSYTDAEFIVHFAGQRGRRKEQLMRHFGALAEERLQRVAKPLRLAGPGALPLVHQTWKSHQLDQVKQAWHMSWRRNGFDVALRNDSEALLDVQRLADSTGHAEFVPAYLSLSPVQRADFWRYAVTYLDGGIYSDIDIAATPETARFFLGRYEPGRTQLVGIIENGPYDNSIGRFHWKVGMSPMYSRVPQLRQSFFYARQGHPRLLALLVEVARMADAWAKSEHTDLGKPGLDRRTLQRMAESGALTLEMTGPGVWTDFMLPGAEGEGAIVLNTMEGYSLIRYGSMGSWKTKDHKGDRLMWRNVLAFYSSPVLLALLYRAYAKYQRGKRSKVA